MQGITLEDFRTYFKKPKATIADLKAITPEQVSDIYMHEYWEGVRADVLKDGVDLSVFDMGVNAGVTRSIKLLQQALGVDVDGILGPHTLKAVYALDAAVLIRRLYTEQLDFYRSLPGFTYFGKGWTNREYGDRAAALSSCHESVQCLDCLRSHAARWSICCSAAAPPLPSMVMPTRSTLPRWSTATVLLSPCRASLVCLSPQSIRASSNPHNRRRQAPRSSGR
jgi:Glycosyl hydrolase 108/Predicted Peptidoglycan domain